MTTSTSGLHIAADLEGQREVSSPDRVRPCQLAQGLENTLWQCAVEKRREVSKICYWCKLSFRKIFKKKKNLNVFTQLFFVSGIIFEL